MYLLLDQPLPPDCDNLGRHKLNDYVVNNMHPDPLQELIHLKYVILSDVHMHRAR